ncbi:MAG: hypothetical protein ABI369_01730 [Acetobacteraceae bacterium]
MRGRTLLSLAASAFAPSAARADATTLTLWHDLGESGTKWFTQAGEAFAKDHAGVSVRAISYPTDQ